MNMLYTGRKRPYTRQKPGQAMTPARNQVRLQTGANQAISQPALQPPSADEWAYQRQFWIENNIKSPIRNKDDLERALAMYDFTQDRSAGTLKDDYYGYRPEDVGLMMYVDTKRIKINNPEDLSFVRTQYQREQYADLLGLSIDETGLLHIPNYGDAWQQLGFEYSGSYEDKLLSQMGLPPQGYIKLYGDSKEDQERRINGYAPIRLENTQRLEADLADFLSYVQSSEPMSEAQYLQKASEYGSLAAYFKYLDDQRKADEHNSSFGVYGLDQKSVDNPFVDNIVDKLPADWLQRVYSEVEGEKVSYLEQMMEEAGQAEDDKERTFGERLKDNLGIEEGAGFGQNVLNAAGSLFGIDKGDGGLEIASKVIQSMNPFDITNITRLNSKIPGLELFGGVESGKEATNAALLRTAADIPMLIGIDSDDKGVEVASKVVNSLNPLNMGNYMRLSGTKQIVEKIAENLGIINLPKGGEPVQLKPLKALSDIAFQNARQIAEKYTGLSKFQKLAGNALAAVYQSGSALAANSIMPGAGSVFFALSAYGGYANEAEAEGATLEQQRQYGIFGALIEGGTEMLPLNFAIKGAKSLKSVIFNKQLLRQGFKVFLKSFGPAAGQAALGSLAEMLQENISDVMSGISKKLLYDKSIKGFSTDPDVRAIINTSQVFETSAVSFGMSLIFGGLGMAADTQSYQLAQEAVTTGKMDAEALADALQQETGEQAFEFEDYDTHQEQLNELIKQETETAEVLPTIDEPAGQKGYKDLLKEAGEKNFEAVKSEKTRKMDLIKEDLEQYHNEGFSEFINRAADKDLRETYTINDKVSDRERNDILKATGVNVEGYKHTIHSNAVTHILNRHGNDGILSIKPEDIASIEYIFDNYDSIEKDTDPKRRYENKIIYKKKIDGVLLYVEAILKKGELRGITMYIDNRKAPYAAGLRAAKHGASLTSENVNGLGATTSISNKANNVTTKEQEYPTGGGGGGDDDGDASVPTVRVSEYKPAPGRLHDNDARQLLKTITGTRLNSRQQHEFERKFLDYYHEGSLNEHMDELTKMAEEAWRYGGSIDQAMFQDAKKVYEYLRGIEAIRLDPEKSGTDARSNTREFTELQEALRGITKVSYTEGQPIDTLYEEIKEQTGVSIGEKEDEIAENLARYINEYREARSIYHGKTPIPDSMDVDGQREYVRDELRKIIDTLTGEKFKAADADFQSLKKLSDKIYEETGRRVNLNIERPNGRRQAYLQKFGKALGLNIVYFSPRSEKIAQNEFIDTDNPGTIFINTRIKGRSVEWAFGHGLIHELRTSHEKLYNKLWEVIDEGSLANDLFGKDLKTEEEFQAYVEEMLADESGNLFATKEFWNKIAQRDNGLFNKIADVIQRILQKIKTFIHANTIMSDYKANVDKLESKLLDIIDEIGAKNTELQKEAGSIGKDGKLLFSERDDLMDDLEAAYRAVRYNPAGDGFMKSRVEALTKDFDGMMNRLRDMNVTEADMKKIEELVRFRKIDSPYEMRALDSKYKEQFAQMKEQVSAMKRKFKQMMFEQSEEFQAHARLLKDEIAAERTRGLEAAKKLEEILNGPAGENIMKGVDYKARLELQDLLTKTLPRKLSRYDKAPLQHGFRKGAIELIESLGAISDDGQSKAMNLSGIINGFKAVNEIHDPTYEMPGGIKELLDMINNRPLQDLDTDEITGLSRILKHYIHLSNTVNTIRVGKQEMSADEILTELETEVSKGRKELPGRKQNAKMNVAGELFGIGAMDLDTLALYLTQNNRESKFYKIASAELDRATHVEAAYNAADLRYFNELLEGIKDIEQWRGDHAAKIKVSIEGNFKGPVKEIELSKGQLIMIALHGRNDYNRAALHNGVRTIEDDGLEFSMSDNDINHIMNLVNGDEDMKKVADGIFRWWNEEYYTDRFGRKIPASKKRLNATSMQMYGYEVAAEENYVPIVRDKELFQKNYVSISKTLESAGSLKMRNHMLTKPIMLVDVFTQLRQHTEFTAKFAAWAPVLKNLKRIAGSPAAQKVFKKYFGRAVDEYYTDYIRRSDGNNGEEAGRLEGWVLKGQSGVKKAIVSSPYIWFNQLTAIPLAVSELDIKYLPGSLTHLDKESLAKMEQYAPYVFMRRYTGGSREVSELITQKNKVRTALDQPSMMVTRIDTMTMDLIWAWAAAEVKSKTNLTGDAYWKEVARLCTRTVERTQSNASLAHTSMVGRSEKWYYKTTFMFTQGLNKVYNMYIQTGLEIKSGNIKKAAKITTAILLQALMMAAKEALRDRIKKKEVSADDFWKNFGMNLMAPVYGSGIVSNIINGFNTISNVPVFDVVEDTIQKTGNIIKGLQNKEGLDWRDFRDLASVSAQLFGIPAYQWERDVIKPILKAVDWKLYDVMYRQKSYTNDYAYAVKRGNEADTRQLAELIAKPGKYISDYTGTKWFQDLNAGQQEAALEGIINALAQASGDDSRKASITGELMELAMDQGKYTIIPVAPKSFSVNGSEITLTDEQYEEAQKIYYTLCMYGLDDARTGRMIKGVPTDVDGDPIDLSGYEYYGYDDAMRSAEYRNADEEEKLKILESIRRACWEMAKGQIFQKMN